MKIIRTKEIDGYTINTYDNGVIEKYITGSKTDTKPEPIEPQPTNADILAALQRSQEELKQEAIDSYTMELMEQGIL